MLPSIGPGKTSFLHFWTLEVELLFYIAVALLFFTFGRLRREVLFAAYISTGLCILYKGFLSGVMFKSPLLAFLMMFWGALCRSFLYFKFYRWSWLAPVKGVDWARSVMFGLLTAPLVFRPIVHFFLPHLGGDRPNWLRLVSVFAAFGFLFWVVFKPVRIGWLSSVGRWTYSTYLLHLVVIMAVHWVGQFPFFSGLYRIPLFFTFLVLIISFAVGAVAYRWIEQPSDAIGKRLAAGR